ncbi:putative lipoprotein [Campylobacter hyointestinalis subsp. hyointestinalis]|uniref:Lipoprotein n=1 Tax=Campylobacter hyointestinalis subsp. hyointestinalis TaxID=91352 RepID=A0A0S4RTB9_CAMHY|nr:LPP20 family lipoprotein [Campylobacter hyointestinalis]CUU76625.1 putative lipoprotein [Campylobacter hyointestinalis subsp. hyointestinalis]
MKPLVFLLVMAGIFAGCVGSISSPENQEVVIQKVDKDDLRNIIKEDKMLADMEMAPEAIFSVIGEGIPPMDTVSPAQAKALAKRAAMVDGYRQLASKLFGVKVNGKETVKDAMLKSSVIEARVNGLIKNAAVINQDFKDGLYRVEMELKLDKDKWQELFAY